MAFIQPANVSINFAGGLQSKTDEIQIQPPSLLELQNAAFDKIGRLNKRFGYDIFSTNVLGGSIITSASAIDNFNDELNLFDNQHLYTYIASVASWANRGIAISLINTNNQITRTAAAQQINPDSAILNNIEVFVYEDTRGGIRYSVLDQATSSYVVGDQVFDLAGAKPKTVIFNNLIYVFYTDDANNLHFKTINPSNPNLTSSQTNLTANGNANMVYDVTVLGSHLFIAYTTSVDTKVVKLDTTNTIIGTVTISDVAVAVNVQKDSLNQIWINYATSTDVRVGAFDSTTLATILSPVVVDTLTCIELTSIESIQAGSLQLIYEAFNADASKTALICVIVKTDGTVTNVGTLRSVGLASKPFRYGKNIYLNIAHESPEQATYFTVLMNDRPFTIVGKISPQVGGGLRTNNMVPESNTLSPGVFQFANLVKGQFISEANTSFSLLGVNSTLIDFTNTNKFNSVTQSNNLLFVGGILQSYDGQSVVEQNFHIYPEGALAFPVGSSGALSAGQYQYKFVYAWTDKFGQIQYSSPSAALTVTTLVNNSVLLVIPTCRLTAKTGAVIKIYRTQVNSTVFQEITSELGPLLNDPTVDTVSFTDTAADVSIAANATIYTNGGVLANSAPPSCSLISLYQDRVMLSGLEDPNLIWFSKNKFNASNFNTIPVEFSSENTIAINQMGGAITALALMDDKLIIFKKSSIWVLNGSGPNDLGGGDQFSPAELVSNSIGCNNPDSVVLTKDGLMFQSDKGIWLLDRGLGAPQYIGAGVDDDGKTHVVSSATVDPNDNLIIFTTHDGPALVYDYYINQWSTWTNHQAVNGVAFGGLFTFCKANGQVYQQNRSSFTDGTKLIPMEFVTPWLSFAQLQGFQSVFRFFILGNFKGPHTLKVSVGFNGDPAFTEFATIDATSVAGSNVWGSDGYWGQSTPWGAVFQPYQFQVNIKRQWSSAIRIKVVDSQTSSYSEGYSISSLSFEVGVMPGHNRLPKANKVGTQ